MSKVVPIHRAQLGRLKMLNELAADADRVVRRHDEIENLVVIVRKMEAMRRGEQLDRLIADTRRKAMLDQHDEALVARCIEALKLLDANENYDDDDPEECGLRRSVVGARLAILAGAFPNSNSVGDPEIYTRTMLENVFTVEGLSLVALDCACHEIVAIQKFLPTTSELLKVLNAEQQKWSERFRAIYHIAHTSRRVVKWIDAMQAEPK